MNAKPNRYQIRALREYREVRNSPAYRNSLSGDTSDESCQAAILLAQSLGYCRLWGVDLGDQDGSVPLRLLPVICSSLTTRIGELIQGLTGFERRMETAATSEEEELLATKILRQRMDGWACWIAIDERVRMLVEEAANNELEELSMQGTLASIYYQWDVDLQARADLLITACDTYLIENWLDSLSEPYSEAVPWWIDEAFWSVVRMQSTPNFIRSVSTLQPMVQPSTVTSDSARGAWFTTPWELTEPLAMAGATAGEEFQRLEFISRQDESIAAIARVAIPTRMSGDHTIAIDVRFSLVRQDPNSVRLGSIVSLGAGADGVVICEYPQGEPPLFRTTITLGSEDVLRLGLEQYVCLMVDRRDWIQRGDHASRS